MENNWNDAALRNTGFPFDTQIAGAIGAALIGLSLLKSSKVTSVRKL